MVAPFGFRSRIKGLPQREQSRRAFLERSLVEVPSGRAYERSDHEIVLYFVSSPQGMDWSSAASLARTTILNYSSLVTHFMGHVNIGLRIDGGPERLYGQAYAHLGVKRELLIHQVGFSVLWYPFPGRFEEHDNLVAELGQHMLINRGSFVVYKVSREAALRVAQYVKEYEEHRIYRYYGLYGRPLHGEVTGCSAFAASVLEVAGLLDEEFTQAGGNEVLIPDDLLGAPLFDRRVDFLSVMAQQRTWARPDEPHHSLFYWDPDRMYQWAFMRSHHREPHADSISLQMDAMPGLVFDRRDKPVPQGPIWKTETTQTPYNQRNDLKPTDAISPGLINVS